MTHKLKVTSPRSFTACGTAVEVHSDKFAVLRMPGIDRSDAGFFNQVQAKVGLPLLVLGPDQEIELCEVAP